MFDTPMRHARPRVKGSQFQYRNEPERRAMFRAWGRVGNWLRWWAMMPLALSKSKSSEGHAEPTAQNSLSRSRLTRRADSRSLMTLASASSAAKERPGLRRRSAPSMDLSRS